MFSHSWGKCVALGMKSKSSAFLQKCSLDLPRMKMGKASQSLAKMNLGKIERHSFCRYFLGGLVSSGT